MQRDLAALEQVVKCLEDCRLVIIDPLSAYFGTRLDSYRDSDVRSVLAPLVQLAERYNMAVIGVMHLNKSPASKAIYRGLGSVAFTAAARTVWLVSTDPDDPDSKRRLLTPAKHNILIEPTGLAFEIKNGCVVFDEEPVTVTSNEALQGTTTVIAPELDKAVTWLKEILRPGLSMASTEVTEQAKAAGISLSALRRAKQDAGVKSFQLRDGEGNRWFLQIP